MVSPDKNLIAAIRESLQVDLQESLSMDELKKLLADYINPLISNNFHKLITILYRVDINESKLRQLLQDNPGEDAGTIIAGLIIERQMQKIKSRESFRKKETDIDENEKW